MSVEVVMIGHQVIALKKMENQKNNVLSMEIRLMMVDTNGSKISE